VLQFIVILKTKQLSIRVFKTAWFRKVAIKARISDSVLCACIEQASRGQIDDLGGGVFKKRLNDNMHRAIILTKSKHVWVYEYLFAKKDRANIEDDELVQFRKLAKAYAELSDKQIAQLIANQHFIEICHDSKD
jgi:hypothetical protein